MNELINKKRLFTDNRYGNYQALGAPDDFFTNRVYLYKIHKFISKLDNSNRENNRLLEIGCADGSFAVLFKGTGYRVIGIDISSKAVASAREKGIQAELADVEEGIPFPDDHFQVVIAAEIIEHLYDTDHFLKEVNRVIKPGGNLFISTPNLASIKNRIRLLLGKYPQYSECRINSETAGHIRNYTYSTLSNQLKENNLEIIKAVSPNILFPMTKNLPIWTKKFAMYLGDYFYKIGSHLIFHARK